ncbi:MULTISPECIES: hypothetical protein [unclassified Microbacterium]|uniref:hypothetical protein n=1 Tax=unclassified Microbacterium TaxID=2609290 RepID=UPI003870409B
MLIVLALVFGAAAGAAAHFAVPGRTLRGAAVGPLLGAVLGALTWMILTWVGWGTDAAGLWLLAIAVPAVVTPLALVVLGRSRAARDEATRTELGIG